MGVLTKHPYFYAYVTHKDSTYAIKYKERPRKHSRDGGSRSLGGPYIKKQTTLTYKGSQTQVKYKKF